MSTRAKRSLGKGEVGPATKKTRINEDSTSVVPSEAIATGSSDKSQKEDTQGISASQADLKKPHIESDNVHEELEVASVSRANVTDTVDSPSMNEDSVENNGKVSESALGIDDDGQGNEDTIVNAGKDVAAANIPSESAAASAERTSAGTNIDHNAQAKSNVNALFPFRMLERVGAITQLESQMHGPPTVCNFNRTFAAPTIQRLRKIELVESVAYLRNLATAEPDEYMLRSNFIVRKDQASGGNQVPAAHFFLVGSARHSVLTGTGSRQICLSLSDRTFPRAIAVLGHVLNQHALYVPTFWKGVSFGTFRAPLARKGGDSPVKSGLRSSGSSGATSSAVIVGPSAPNVRPFGQDIPVFDGTNGFDLSNVSKLERYHGEILQDAAVLVTFTVGRYGTSAGVKYNGKDVVTSISFNLQTLVLVAPPSFGKDVAHGGASEEPVGVLPEVLISTEVEQVLSIELADDSSAGVWM